jgi:hypothetical protein
MKHIKFDAFGVRVNAVANIPFIHGVFLAFLLFVFGVEVRP